jgi:hypothetical protein
VPAPRKRDRIILTQCHRPPSQPLGFAEFLHPISDPAICLAPDAALGCHAVGRGKVRI